MAIRSPVLATEPRLLMGKVCGWRDGWRDGWMCVCMKKNNERIFLFCNKLLSLYLSLCLSLSLSLFLPQQHLEPRAHRANWPLPHLPGEARARHDQAPGGLRAHLGRR